MKFCAILLSFLIFTATSRIVASNVEVNLHFNPLPIRTMRFNVETDGPTDFSFSLPLNESTQISQLTCVQHDKEIIKSVVTDSVVTVTVSLQDSNRNTFNCEYFHITGVTNYPSEKTLNDDYKLLFTTHMCPLATNMKCTSFINKNNIYKISLFPSPVSEGSQRFKYGPIESTGFTYLVFHYKTQLTPIVIGSVKKVMTIEKENVHVHMEIEDFKNTGAKLKGEFDRNAIPNEMTFYNIQIPVEKDASDLEYRDTTGLITTSEMYGHTLILPTRYPLLGGWKTSFEVNYHFPLKNIIATSGEKMRLLTPMKIEIEGIVKKGVFEVVLPEGSNVNTISFIKRTFENNTVEQQSAFATIFKKTVVKMEMDGVDFKNFADNLEVYYTVNPAAEQNKNIIVACLASSIIVVFLLYAKIINN
ncbi:hypothetical protein EIN_153180 [Entamoeba invadens IP1]|uniref:Dolichyl-diphosphooligosaccharide--protein glycosyltransferase subunit 1 n=1 Tax=Entamoeba invadens IP1 TaxID=370355 RepID=A0A0A1UEQ6_ENTIV|nr:hypothetical protein EIN_153180 [Entamoeba invadens IP1]ELP91311.1 hypothetical protein EIN_153180 [Entamoeba invadens IP1]|eukprot:XP_004258082.1 hypothetical protein EIN_153180 [Entamoeba invadens IP1]